MKNYTVIKRITAGLTATAIACTMVFGASAEEYKTPAREFSYSLLDRSIVGNDRYDTAAMVAMEGSTMMYGEKSKGAVLVSGKDFPDALSASIIANREKIPIIYADSSDSNTALDFIKKRTTAKSPIYIVGGNSAVPSEIETQLKAENHKVTRLCGNNRYSTNLAVLNHEFKTNSSIYMETQTIFVCSGANYPDALVASAGRNPILLVSSELSSSQIDILKSKKLNAVIVGGTGAVSSKVESQLKSTVKSVSRIAGKTRYETSAKFAKKYFTGSKTWVVVDGNSFPDALCGTYLASGWFNPIILASESVMAANNTTPTVYSSLTYPEKHIYIGRIAKTARKLHDDADKLT